MASAVERLLNFTAEDDCFQTPPAELLPLQLEAANERLNSQLCKIRLLQNRAESGGVREIRKTADLVPLLFAHTAYKSYAESWLMEGKWERMGKWLETVSACRAGGLDLSGVLDL